jgi:excisionase family DNA binding protein
MRSFDSGVCGTAPVASLPAIDGNCHQSAGISPSSSAGSSHPKESDNPPSARGCEPRFLTIREAAGALRVSESTIRNAISSGQLRAFRFGARGGSIRIGMADLEDYMASCTTAKPKDRTAVHQGGSLFKSLDAGRLLAAWKRQGVLDGSNDK